MGERKNTEFNSVEWKPPSSPGTRSLGTPTKDDVARLSRGKASRNKVGSRATSHRLRADELKKLEVAKERGYLVTTPTTRDALMNTWYLWCEATGIPFKVERRGG